MQNVELDKLRKVLNGSNKEIKDHLDNYYNENGIVSLRRLVSQLDIFQFCRITRIYKTVPVYIHNWLNEQDSVPSMISRTSSYKHLEEYKLESDTVNLEELIEDVFYFLSIYLSCEHTDDVVKKRLRLIYNSLSGGVFLSIPFLGFRFHKIDEYQSEEEIPKRDLLLRIRRLDEDLYSAMFAVCFTQPFRPLSDKLFNEKRVHENVAC